MARTRVAAALLTSRTAPGAALAGTVFLALWSCCHPAGSLSASSLGAGERALSLHPPYFNLAETTRIWATATCGQDESGRPRLELFCKLVGGPAASPAGQTIQVREMTAGMGGELVGREIGKKNRKRSSTHKTSKLETGLVTFLVVATIRVAGCTLGGEIH